MGCSASKTPHQESKAFVCKANDKRLTADRSMSCKASVVQDLSKVSNHTKKPPRRSQTSFVFNANDRPSLVLALGADELSASTSELSGGEDEMICIVRSDKLDFKGTGIRRHSKRKRKRHSGRDTTRIMVVRQPSNNSFASGDNSSRGTRTSRRSARRSASKKSLTRTSSKSVMSDVTSKSVRESVASERPSISVQDEIDVGDIESGDEESVDKKPTSKTSSPKNRLKKTTSKNKLKKTTEKNKVKKPSSKNLLKASSKNLLKQLSSKSLIKQLSSNSLIKQLSSKSLMRQRESSSPPPLIDSDDEESVQPKNQGSESHLAATPNSKKSLVKRNIERFEEASRRNSNSTETPIRTLQRTPSKKQGSKRRILRDDIFSPSRENSEVFDTTNSEEPVRTIQRIPSKRQPSKRHLLRDEIFTPSRENSFVKPSNSEIQQNDSFTEATCISSSFNTAILSTSGSGDMIAMC